MTVANSFLSALLEITNLVLGLYIWVLVIGAALSWLIAFDVVNTRNRLVAVIGDFCYRITEPALRRIRRYLPALGGIDLSPVILILFILFLQSFLRHLVVA